MHHPCVYFVVVQGLLNVTMMALHNAKHEQREVLQAKLAAKRKQVTMELVETEQNFVEAVAVIDGLYRDTMQPMETEDRELLFNNIKDILRVNGALLEALKVQEKVFDAKSLERCFDIFLDESVPE